MKIKGTGWTGTILSKDYEGTVIRAEYTGDVSVSSIPQEIVCWNVSDAQNFVGKIAYTFDNIVGIVKGEN